MRVSSEAWGMYEGGEVGGWVRSVRGVQCSAGEEVHGLVLALNY